MKKLVVIAILGVLGYLGYVYITDPIVGPGSSCEDWLRASEDHRLSAVDEYVQDHSEAESSDRWERVYAKYVTTACEGRHADSSSAPDNVGDNLDDAVQVTNQIRGTP